MPEVSTVQKLKLKGEDRHSHQLLANGMLYVGVFDGHNGSLAADLCATKIPQLLANITESNKPISEQLLHVFKTLHKSVSDESGTTASIALIFNNYIVTAHVGDSRIVLYRNNQTVQITEDHKLDLNAEKQRIRDHEILHKQSLICGNRVDMLAMTRSIGDHEISNVILWHPIVHELNFSDTDEFLIIASDGLWDVCSLEDVTNLIKIHHLETANEVAAKLLYFAEQEYSRRSITKDDITVSVVALHQEPHNNHSLESLMLQARK